VPETLQRHGAIGSVIDRSIDPTVYACVDVCLAVCLFVRLRRSTDVMIGGLRVVVCGYGEVSNFFIMFVIRNCCILSTLNHLAALDFLHLTVAIIYRYIQFLNYSVVTSSYETLGAIYINDLWNFRNL